VKQDYVILRDLSAGAEPGFETVGPPDIRLETATLSHQTATDLAGQPGHTVAPVMPLALVEPVGSSGADVVPDGTSWGVEAVGATESPFTGAGITVAVLDTGIDASHPAFHGMDVTEKDFVDDGGGDPDGHGTHVAGTIAGQDVDGQRIGVARGVSKLLACKVLGGKSRGTETVIRAIEWAAIEGGAHIISMSLRIDFAGYVSVLRDEGVAEIAATSQALSAYGENLRMMDNLAAYLRARSPLTAGVLLIAATGNESDRAGPDGGYTVNAAWPAASAGLIAVGAVGRQADGTFTVADFSNTGPRLSAPGVSIVSAWPNGRLRSQDGTSMATPHVAGVAALWAQRELERNPDAPLDLAAVQAALDFNTRPLPGLTQPDVGRGLVRAPIA
jgi:subtilisin family serine protease